MIKHKQKAKELLSHFLKDDNADDANNIIDAIDDLIKARIEEYAQSMQGDE